MQRLTFALSWVFYTLCAVKNAAILPLGNRDAAYDEATIMGKRSDFERLPRDAYDTPLEAVLPLLPHLPKRTKFVEPCAGRGALKDSLVLHQHQCLSAFDIEPRRGDIKSGDALKATIGEADCFITNPPWDRKILHPLIWQLAAQAPVWLLFDSDWMHTKQSVPYMTICEKIVSVGRVKWIPGSKMTGKDNCCWYLFSKDANRTRFIGR